MSKSRMYKIKGKPTRLSLDNGNGTRWWISGAHTGMAARLLGLKS